MSKRSSTQGPLALSAKVLAMRCSVVSGNRDGGTKGVDAGGKARSASRDKLRFKGLEASVAAGPGAAAVCASGLITAGPVAAAGGEVIGRGEKRSFGVGSMGSLRSGRIGGVIGGCKEGSSTSTVGANRGACTGALGKGMPFKASRKAKCRKSTSAAASKRKRSKTFHCASFWYSLIAISRKYFLFL